MTKTIKEKLEFLIKQDEVVDFLLYVQKKHPITFSHLVNEYFYKKGGNDS